MGYDGTGFSSFAHNTHVAIRHHPNVCETVRVFFLEYVSEAYTGGFDRKNEQNHLPAI